MKRWFHQTLIVGLFLCGYICLSPIRSGGDIYETARLGLRWVEGDYTGLEGYDGQYAHFIALDPTIAFDTTRAYKYLDIYIGRNFDE
jgi:hypothetical protein